MEIVLVLMAGIAGGVLNSILVEKGFIHPGNILMTTGRKKLDLGFFNNLILGAGAAFVVYAFGASELPFLKQLAMSLLGGIGGGNILTSMLQKHEIKLANTKINEFGKRLSDALGI